MKAIALASTILALAVVPPANAVDNPCPEEPCGCNQPPPVYLIPYFVPSYSGWQTARRIWTYMGGGTTAFRFFKYSSDDYELIKSTTGLDTETFEVAPAGVYVTSEMGSPLGSQARIFLGDGLYFLPNSICTNHPYFRMCHQGQKLLSNTSCLQTGTVGSRCAVYLSKIEMAPAWNYGYSIGVIDSIIKIDKLDNGEVEKYWYALGRGLMRWEHYNVNGQLLSWGRQASEIPNSPIPHNSCVQPL